MQETIDNSVSFESLKLEDFGVLQARYSTMKIAHRAGAMLADAKPALAMAETILNQIGSSGKSRHLFEKLRKNNALIAKMRPSDAKTTLLDGSIDFMDITRKKILAWRKTIERLSMGEAIRIENDREFISSRDPLCAAILSITSLCNYLSVIQLAIIEQAKTDPENAPYYQSMVTKLRRCAIVISDSENAARINAMVH